MGHSLTGFCAECGALFCLRYHEVRTLMRRLRALGDATTWDLGDIDIAELNQALTRLEPKPDRSVGILELIVESIPWIAPGLRPHGR